MLVVIRLDEFDLWSDIKKGTISGLNKLQIFELILIVSSLKNLDIEVQSTIKKI